MIHTNITPQRPPNLAVIAAKAGVSRVINNKPVVSATTRQGVLAVIEQAGYTASARRDSPLVDHFLHSNTPFILVERPAHQQDRISYVTIDNFHAAWIVVSHLIMPGRKRIGMLTGDLRIIDAADRLAGCQHTLRDAGCTVDNALIFQGDFTPQSGYEDMQYLLTQGVGALRALDETGVPVPQAVAMVSIDDLPTAVRVTAALTTVQHPIEEKGAYAAEVLLKTKLIIRESCGATTVQ